jgi:hypothetical protein
MVPFKPRRHFKIKEDSFVGYSCQVSRLVSVSRIFEASPFFDPEDKETAGDLPVITRFGPPSGCRRPEATINKPGGSNSSIKVPLR